MKNDQVKVSEIIYAGTLLLVTLIYYWSAQLGFVFAWKHTNVSAIWPPSAVAFLVIYYLGYRLWPAIWAGAFLVNVGYFLSNPSLNLIQNTLSSALIGAGNTLEVLMICYFLKKLVGSHNPLHKVQDILSFMIIAMGGCAVAASIGSLIVSLNDPLFWKSYGIVWLTWWLGDLSSLLTLIPLVFALGQKPALKNNPKVIIEFIVSVSILVFINSMIFDGKTIISQTHVPVTYLPLALMVWLTYRFGYWGAVICILTTLYQSVQGTIHGFGPFITADPNMSLLLLQTFIVTVCGTTLLLAATLYERRQMLQEINFSEQRFRALVENSLDMIALLNPVGVITYTSPSAQRVMGFRKQEHEGHSIFEFIHPEDEAYIMSKFSRVLSHPTEIISAIMRVRHKDGSWRWIESYGQNLLNDPVVGAIVVNYKDITERRLAEDILKRDKKVLEMLIEERSKELLQVQNELKQASRLADMGTLAAIVAHELRTPLGVIQMAVHNLKNKHKELVSNHHLENIEKKIWEGNNIIDNLLSYSRVKAPSYQSCLILNLVEECISNFDNVFKDSKVDILREYQVSSDFKIEVDTHQIREVLVNVLNNAYQALSNKSGTITIGVGESEKGQLQISIKDNGVGIEPSDLDKIFLPFFTTKAKGTGLGLAICNEIIHFHHGYMNVQSVKEQGTVVNIILPFRK